MTIVWHLVLQFSVAIPLNNWHKVLQFSVTILLIKVIISLENDLYIYINISIGYFLCERPLSIDHSLYIFYPISGKFTKVVKITPGIWMALMEGKGQELQDKVRIFKQWNAFFNAGYDGSYIADCKNTWPMFFLHEYN